MLSAPEKLAASPGRMATDRALRCSGTATTVGSLVAATTVRVIAAGAGVVCAVAGATTTSVMSSPTAKVLRSMSISLGFTGGSAVQRHLLKSKNARHEHPAPSL